LSKKTRENKPALENGLDADLSISSDTRPTDTEPEVKVVDRRWWAQNTTESEDEEVPFRKPTYVEDLEQQLAERNELLTSTRAKYKEAVTEFDEARVRLRKEIMKDLERSKRSTLVEFLEVVDNLERALVVARETPNLDALLKGVALVRDQFMNKLKAANITRAVSLGERFDPKRHEAISTVPATKPEEDNLVVGVVTEGYLIGDEVLRAAKVAVAKKTEA